MMNKKYFSLLFTVSLILFLCMLFICTSCNEPENNQDGDTQPDDTDKGTQIEFKNLEDFLVTIYSDPARQNIVTTINGKSSKKIPAIPNITGVVFYPTFSIDIPYIQYEFIPYNAPEIITVIEEDKTTQVFIPKLESIEIENAYFRIENKSDFSLSFQYGNTELSPLGGRPNIIVPNESAVYKIIPGNVFGFSLRRNTTTPVAFPGSVIEFKAGNMYSFTYSGSNLIFSSMLSLPASLFPSAPKDLKAEIVSETSVKLTWEPVYGASSYRIYRGSTLVTTVTTSSYTITNITAGTNYQYSIKALVSDNEGQSSTIMVSMPPANVRWTNRTNTGITIGWDAITGANGYNIYRSNAENGIYEKLNDTIVTSTSYLDKELTVQCNYYYKVTAVINNIQSLNSLLVSVSTLSNVPVNMRVTLVNINSIIFEWDALDDNSCFNIYRSDSENGIYNKLNTDLQINNNYSDTGLDTNKTYYYKVSSIISGIESDHSIPFSVSTLSDVPFNAGVAAMNTSSITLRWDAISGVTGYNIYRSDNENGLFNKINTELITSNNYSDAGLTAYAAYYYKITSTTSDIESDYSDIVSGSAGVIVPGESLSAKLTWLKKNVLSNSLYVIELSVDENIMPQNLSYSGKNNINITLNSTANTINLSSNGIILTIDSGVTLTLNNITLNGRTNNNDSLVKINNNGVLILNEGAKITGNTIISSIDAYGGGVYLNGGTLIMNGGQITGNSISVTNTSYTSYYGRGGGVYISSGVFTLNAGEISGNNISSVSYGYAHGGGVYIADGMFNMNGGEILGNSCTSSYSSGYSYAAGVYAASGSVKFRISSGVIYGSNAPGGSKNTSGSYSALYCGSSGVAQYGNINNNTFYRTGNFTTSVNITIRIVDGTLLSE